MLDLMKPSARVVGIYDAFSRSLLTFCIWF